MTTLYARIAGLVAIVIAIAAPFGIGYHAGGNAARRACAQAAAALQRAGQAAVTRAESAGAEAAQTSEAREQAREPGLQVIEKEVIRYVERNRPRPQAHPGTAGGAPEDSVTAGPAGPHVADADRPGCGLDADGLRLWAAANRGELPDPAAAPGAALPDAGDGTGFRLTARSAGQPYGMGAGAAPLPRPAFGFDRLADGSAPPARLSFSVEHPAPVQWGQ
jgi:hypothetical protein